MSIWMEPRGFGSGVAGHSQTSLIVVLVFLAISYYNVIELNFIIWGTFRRYSGLYFWTFVVATWGIPFYCSGFLIKYFGSPSLGYLSCTLIVAGWVCMVSGQSMVLWSRLHLILRNRKRLRLILWMIIVDGIICHGAIIPMVYGSFSSRPEIWHKPYSVMEKIQVTIFFLQEMILSSFYIIQTVRLIKLDLVNGQSNRRLMNHLVFVNILIMVLDVTILGLEYANQYEYQTAYKAFVYSTKLKLEFSILNRLVEMTSGAKNASSGPRSRTHHTTVNNTNIPMETFASEAGGKTATVSYQAYATADIERGQVPVARHSTGVMMTTEITLHRDEGQDDGIRSIRRDSSADSATGAAKTCDGESKTSSEVHLATRGF
ncbi:hypothetical protein B0T10DRAFT_563054 [Thelonectria olida]|uniref:DUF7703 domain-containing protein n=1 Tax=Thelonectria olida TaxID=1576542 RepID=A0A9P8W355_9HYPO|nr:hypothetical protein B0T10DRAFT_563054 [Thelonectria olida]